jgi:beta-1,4-mannosyl-glycoprotein beta-1,4-N-acetylglucosaminyltransferase
MKVWDCFPFHHELDVLEIRLRELDRVVDRFVIVEADRTHMGDPKPLFFRENSERFSAFRDRIIHITVTDMPETKDAWVRENFQRNAIQRGLQDCRDGDWIVISDADEIPRADVIADLRDRRLRPWRTGIVGLRMPLYYCRLNYVNLAGSAHVTWGVATRANGPLRQPQKYRHVRTGFDSQYWKFRMGLTGCTSIPHAGWHFSYIGDEAMVRQKLRATAHSQEDDYEPVAETLQIDRLIQQRQDLMGRAEYRWELVQIDSYYPECVTRDPARFAAHIAPGATRHMGDFDRLMDYETKLWPKTRQSIRRRIPAF